MYNKGREIRRKYKRRKGASTVEISTVPEGLLPAAEVACFCACLECEETVKALTYFLCLS